MFSIFVFDNYDLNYATQQKTDENNRFTHVMYAYKLCKFMHKKCIRHYDRFL